MLLGYCLDAAWVLLVGGGDEVWSFSGWLRPKSQINLGSRKDNDGQ